jgi:alanine-synthesizing transaminase
MDNLTFAHRFREALEKKHLKQIELVRYAETRGVKLGKSHLSQYLSGKTIPRREMLQFLAEALDVDPDWLLGNKQETVNSPKGLDEGMRTFNKSAKLDNVLYDVRGPVVEEAARMEDEGTQVLKLNIGNPAPFGFRAPDEVIYDMARQLTE